MLVIQGKNWLFAKTKDGYIGRAREKLSFSGGKFQIIENTSKIVTRGEGVS